MKLRPFSLLLSAFLFGAAAIGAPVANPDDFETTEDMALSVDAAEGLLANDVESTSVALQDDASSGELDLNADGSFTYTPGENFNGQDTFTYVSQNLPQTLTFTVDQSMSEVDFAATISAAGITQTRSDSSSITGTLEVHLRPPGEPFDVVHVRDVDLVVADDISLNYRVSIIFPLVDVTVSAEAGAIELDMLQAGAESTANAAGEFAQPSNDFQLRGDANVVVDVDTLGLGIPEGAQALDTALEDVDLNGTLSESGGIITLNMPVAFEGIFDLSGNPVTVEIEGLIVATAPVPTVEESSPATVTIDVDPVNDAPLALSERYRTISGSALSVAATPAGGDEVLLAAGSTWRYLDDGSDQGMAWREAGFDDAAWATGAAKLGYGEGDEATVIGFGGDPNNVHVTSYFRAEFDVADPDGAGDLLLRLQRDDGAAVFLNGIEVARDGLPEGAAFDTLASEVTGGTDEEAFFEFTIPASALVAGANTIAVEVHQASIDSSDVSFDLELVRSPTAGVLANDSDLDGDTLSAVQVGPATGGTVLLGLDGSFTFTPATGFSGEGGFVYAVSDGAGTAPVPIIPADAIWRYLDNGTDQGTAWTATGFDDSPWLTGAAELGYGEGDEATVVGFGGDPDNKFQTTYFRHEFNLGDPAAIAALTFRLVRDDAAAVYVNGTEVYRDGTLPVGATFLTLASAPVDESMIEIAIAVTPDLLDVGANVIAVEVHQSSLNSSDLSFSLSATAQTMPPQVVVSPGATWSYLDDGSDQSTAWSDPVFDDSAWDAGAGPLGYGSGEATTLSFGGDPDNKHATTYFRHRFEVVGASGANAGILKVRRDDGVAVYLNGTEIARDRVAPGAGAGDFATGATSDSLSYRVYGFDPALLMEGENVLAAEVHQASGTSSDIVFDAELSFSSAQVLRVARVDIVDGGGDEDTDMDGMADSYEVANGLTVGVDDSALDLDGDGRSNLSESIAGTAANDSNSFLRIVSIAPAAAPGSLEITIETVPGKVYQLQSSADGETWSNVGDTWMAEGTSQMVTEPAVGDELFWRAAVVVP